MTNSSVIHILGIIPARYASTRFPGKPLALIGNKPVIQWVYERSSDALDEVFVATDDERIFNCVRDFGGQVVMTSKNHQSGTDRCAEALEIVESMKGKHFNIVVNIQGDEPFIDPGQIKQLVDLFSDPSTEIATLVTEINCHEDLLDPNKPKVIVDTHDFALLFSRAAIPYVQGADVKKWHLRYRFLKHIGIYAFLPDVLRKITVLPPSGLELAESLEQLRWLENGYRIKVGTTTIENIGIDTPEDLENARKVSRNLH